jgi:hypothetical protein
MANKNWTENARLALNTVKVVCGEKINQCPQYVSARTQLLAGREGLYRNAMKALVDVLTDEHRQECRKQMVVKVALNICEESHRSLTGGAVL